MEFKELVQKIEKEHKVISVVGAGGKSTLINRLAEELTLCGKKVLVTTTTHIWKPEPDIFAESAEEAEVIWGAGSYAVAGTVEASAVREKLRSPELKQWPLFLARAEIVLIEADGAKGKPCKLPAAHEPVISEETTLVLGVMGMDCLDHPAAEVCFRWKEEGGRFFEDDAPEGEQRITEKLAAKILSSGQGTRKSCGSREYIAVLNKCDTEELRRRAERIEKRLKEEGVAHVVMTSFQKGTIT